MVLACTTYIEGFWMYPTRLTTQISHRRLHGLYIRGAESSFTSTIASPSFEVPENFKRRTLLTFIMDDSWVEHVTAILDYLEGRTQAPNTQTQQSARDLMTSLDAWSFIGSASHYGLQVRALTILQRLAYYDADRGAIRDIASWVLERWLRMLQCYPRSVSGLQGTLVACQYSLEAYSSHRCR